jgi:hypothetical protein
MPFNLGKMRIITKFVLHFLLFTFFIMNNFFYKQYI